MDLNKPAPPPPPVNRTTERLALYQNQLSHGQPPATTTTPHPATPHPTTHPPPRLRTMARDPITCHALNTLTGTPAANLPVTLSLLSSSASSSNSYKPILTYYATTDADGRVKHWTSASFTGSTSVPEFLAALPADDSKTSWSVRFETGPWYAAQGVESFWPEVEVKFVVKGRGIEGEGGWRHYHVPVLLGPWSYSTYRGS